MKAIPRYPAEVTGGWLSGVLSTPAEPVEVTAADVAPVGTGQTGATYRVSVTYAGNPAGLPDAFVIKLPATDDTVRDRVALGYRSECAFYTGVADRVRIPIPQCFHCESSADATEYALLLADCAPAAQGEQIAGCDEQQARLAVTALAGLHAPTWRDEQWLTFSGLAMTQLDAAGAKGMGDVAKMSAEIVVDKLGAMLGEADCETLTAALDLVTPWLLAPLNRFSLIHGDYRLDNMLFTPDGGRIWVVDWQTLGVGLPARDLAYFTGTSLEPGLRSAIEGDLVTAYHSALLGHGVVDYDRETCWQDYRFGAIQVPLISALGFAFAVGTDRGDDMIVTMLRRGCQAIRELGTLDLVRQIAL
ncbi:MAG TPA: aminoglycoside phosphotransferase family protein [Mycobacterium sp.]|nr:aminoglycoside phosphotransferase family protein [Mycobacterium sp.]